MSIPLLDLKREYAPLAEEISLRWSEALDAMRLLNGVNVTRLEEEIAAYVGLPHAVGTSSGTDAMMLGLRALGIGTGDEVILHSNAFTANVEAVWSTGAQPVLVDVAEEGWGPDPEAVARALTPRTRALLIVHLYGAPVQLAPLQRLANERGLLLVEDASHAHGAARNGQRVGSFGAVGCFSAGVVKNLGAYGDAGFVTTHNTDVADTVRLLQNHGQARKNSHVLYGGNYRLDELQAVVLRVKLGHLDARNRRRREIATFYSSRFAPLGLAVPVEYPGEVHVYHQYVIRTPRRDALRAHLGDHGIETGIHYPVPLHRQPAWLRTYGETPALPRAERLAREILSLPVFPDLTDAEVEHVSNSVTAFFHS
jgi:dTDP-4-amino-4,6-dideoxygalactose transaminase